MKGSEAGEKPCHGKQAGIKTGEGEGTWDPIPVKEVDKTLLCGAANGDRENLHLSVVLNPSARQMV